MVEFLDVSTPFTVPLGQICNVNPVIELRYLIWSGLLFLCNVCCCSSDDGTSELSGTPMGAIGDDGMVDNGAAYVSRGAAPSNNATVAIKSLIKAPFRAAYSVTLITAQSDVSKIE